MCADLFAAASAEPVEWLGPGTCLLRGRALAVADQLRTELEQILAAAPLRHLVTPGGHRMSVAMSNCGSVGWTSDPGGYRYAQHDPQSGRRWPAMPPSFVALANSAAAQAGFVDYAPDACLINRYLPGTRLTLHQDRNEKNLLAPVVSVSLGMSATFLLGGMVRSDPTRKLELYHGDVLIWGGPDRMRFHGVQPISSNPHPEWGSQRINLTFRRAL